LAERLAEACQLILDVTGASITVENTTMERVTLRATNDVAARLDDLKDVLGQGPATTRSHPARRVALRWRSRCFCPTP
jgi:hypothetical protein